MQDMLITYNIYSGMKITFNHQPKSTYKLKLGVIGKEPQYYAPHTNPEENHKGVAHGLYFFNQIVAHIFLQIVASLCPYQIVAHKFLYLCVLIRLWHTNFYRLLHLCGLIRLWHTKFTNSCIFVSLSDFGTHI